ARGRIQMQSIADARPLARPEPDPDPGWLRRAGAWFLDRRLVIAAVLAWSFTIAAFLLAHLSPVPHAAIIGLYVFAYLAGGTDATRQALSDLFVGHVNVDLLMVVAALGAATLNAWAEGAVLLALFASSNALEHHALDRTRNAVHA